jgi:hypothetical protein
MSAMNQVYPQITQISQIKNHSRQVENKKPAVKRAFESA